MEQEYAVYEEYYLEKSLRGWMETESSVIITNLRKYPDEKKHLFLKVIPRLSNQLSYSFINFQGIILSLSKLKKPIYG